MSNHLLILDRPLIILPKLAVVIGLNEAIVLQQMYYLCGVDKCGKVLADGNKYIFNTYETWRSSYFPFLSVATIQRVFSSLEESGYIVSCQPEGGISRRKYYRLHDANILKLREATGEDDAISVIHTSSQSDMIDVAGCYLPLTETSSETTSEIRTDDAPSSPGLLTQASLSGPSSKEPRKVKIPTERLLAVVTSLMKIDNMVYNQCACKTKYYGHAKSILRVCPEVTDAEINTRFDRLKRVDSWVPSHTAQNLVAKWGALSQEPKSEIALKKEAWIKEQNELARRY